MATNPDDVKVGDLLSWPNWAGEQIVARVTFRDRWHISTDLAGVFFEARVGRPLELVLANVTHHPA